MLELSWLDYILVAQLRTCVPLSMRIAYCMTQSISPRYTIVLSSTSSQRAFCNTGYDLAIRDLDYRSQYFDFYHGESRIRSFRTFFIQLSVYMTLLHECLEFILFPRPRL